MNRIAVHFIVLLMAALACSGALAGVGNPNQYNTNQYNNVTGSTRYDQPRYTPPAPIPFARTHVVYTQSRPAPQPWDPDYKDIHTGYVSGRGNPLRVLDQHQALFTKQMDQGYGPAELVKYHHIESHAVKNVSALQWQQFRDSALKYHSSLESKNSWTHARFGGGVGDVIYTQKRLSPDSPGKTEVVIRQVRGRGGSLDILKQNRAAAMNRMKEGFSPPKLAGHYYTQPVMMGGFYEDPPGKYEADAKFSELEQEAAKQGHQNYDDRKAQLKKEDGVF